MRLRNVLPESFRNCRPVQVLERSYTKGRLAHGILLYGNNLNILEEVGKALAGVLLDSPGKAAFHPDFFVLRPSNKMRQINAENTRELIRRVHFSAYQGGNKVAFVYEADRMNKAAANIFLKTLEEPPPGTTILLLSTRPYDLLETIRSRTFHFRLPARVSWLSDETWEKWLQDYRKWLGLLLQADWKISSSRTEAIVSLYGLIARFREILCHLGDATWREKKETLPEGLSPEEIDALEVGTRKGFCPLLFHEIEVHTCEFTLGKVVSGKEEETVHALFKAIVSLECCTGLLEVNLKEEVAIEHFLLRSLRFWTRRRK